MSSLARIARLSLGTALAFAAYAFAFHLMGGELKPLFQPNMALIVAGGPVALLVSSRQLQRLANAALGAGVLGVIMGLVHVMSNLDKPATIGTGVAVSLCAILYGLGAAFVFGSAGAGERAAGQGRVPDLTPYALM